jgi:hypothetical protein
MASSRTRSADLRGIELQRFIIVIHLSKAWSETAKGGSGCAKMLTLKIAGFQKNTLLRAIRTLAFYLTFLLPFYLTYL